MGLRLTYHKVLQAVYSETLVGRMGETNRDILNNLGQLEKTCQKATKHTRRIVELSEEGTTDNRYYSGVLKELEELERTFQDYKRIKMLGHELTHTLLMD